MKFEFTSFSNNNNHVKFSLSTLFIVDQQFFLYRLDILILFQKTHIFQRFHRFFAEIAIDRKLDFRSNFVPKNVFFWQKVRIFAFATRFKRQRFDFGDSKIADAGYVDEIVRVNVAVSF